ncbi:L-serine ammonia-lyase [Rothia sp. ND6WE1A]|uniref:L-serine ammonia-lyase n=1 Tax=Rothia sp. ND6WE1A TaxID=1848190 RepID=UPI000835C4A7|nr:L-serine ammonia-lyase [Rothia sp. ND6WE1A]
MYISIFDMFKIGIGPSSSHTLGPMKAGKAFVDQLIEEGKLDQATHVQVKLYGSLSLTGKGHSTDKAVLLGLAGEEPETVDIDGIDKFIASVVHTEKIKLNGTHEVDFPADDGMYFFDEYLPMHENGMCIVAFNGDEELLHKTYYSIGGGFIVDQENFAKRGESSTKVPYEFSSAEELLQLCAENNLTFPELAWANELALHSEEEIKTHLDKIWKVMKDGVERGSHREGPLPGNLLLPRRAGLLRRRLEAQETDNGLTMMSWVNLFAMSVSEENASIGRVVTAPTNGACGIVPAVIHYYDKFVEPVTEKIFADYIMASNLVAGLYKMNASISGAEVGCQGEVGVACSMAAAGLAQLEGGTPEQICVAAEIAMEHKLGLTCDPVGGLVQIPCIERNGVASLDAINAASMAMERESAPTVSLDKVIATMYQTGKDMNSKYRETSLGGLATTVLPVPPVCG